MVFVFIATNLAAYVEQNADENHEKSCELRVTDILLKFAAFGNSMNNQVLCLLCKL
jgi:hypothetical protein